MAIQPSLFSDEAARAPQGSPTRLADWLERFTWHDRTTEVSRLATAHAAANIPVFTNEFWTSKQRAASSLHEISYRACFKPQLPGFFLELLSREQDTIYDPFAGRGTTLVEAALRGRVPAGCDVNPLSAILVQPRLAPPALADVEQRLSSLRLSWHGELPEDLLTFYHHDTLTEICALRDYLLNRAADGTSDLVDDWIRMVAVNRLTGHSNGFLSVYTLPPNQAVSVQSQRKINRDRNQTPPRRDLRRILIKKTAALLQDVDGGTRALLARMKARSCFHVGSCIDTFWAPASIQLVITSPPFLNVVDYATDNWLRCWFCGIAASDVPLQLFRKVEDWSAFIVRAFQQFHRLLTPGGFVAFEVGEVLGGALKLEEHVLPAGASTGLVPVCVVVNQQTFTKTANIWGVSNNAKGTNTNRIVVFQKR